MTEATHSCPSKESLVSYLYDEEDANRSTVDAHLQTCASCRDEITGFRDVRVELSGWSVPKQDVHVAVLTRDARERPWTWLFRPAFALPAAAVLLLGAAAGLANLELRYGQEGLVIRTGWAARDADRSARSVLTRGDLELPVSPASLSSSTQVELRGGPTRGAQEPWRSDLAALERQLRHEFLSAGIARSGSAGIARVSVPADPDAIRRIQTLIDESEVRQQRNLALRIAELARDFDLQRKSDLVQIQQGLGRLEGRTEAEAARARELMNYIVRVSQPQGQPR